MELVTRFDSHLRSSLPEEQEYGLSGAPVFEIASIHDLIRLIGYAKHLNREEIVLLRGQTKLYQTLTPSLLRCKNNYSKILKKYKKLISSFQIAGYQKADKLEFEAVLQHYGIKTPHLDLVDNVWVALWFATHSADSKSYGPYWCINYHVSNEEYSYILMLASDASIGAGATESVPGISVGKATTLIDLRRCSSSRILRPHAQHAYILSGTGGVIKDYSRFVVGVAKIPTELGLDWVGRNSLLCTESLFPPATCDSGYGKLLERVQTKISSSNVKAYGAIQIITGE